MIERQKTISISSRIDSIDHAVSEAVSFATKHGVSEEAVFGIDMAVREVVANAVKHGNKFDEEKPVEISFKTTSEGFEVVIRDYGEGFDVEGVPDPTNPENLLKADGRGILFMRTFMDLVEWSNHEDGGTLVRMVKIC